MFAVLRLPYFYLQAAQRWRAKLPFVAVSDDTKTKGPILESSLSAQACGVLPGMTAAQALARCPELHLLPKCPLQEAACSRILVETAFQYSPYIEATVPHIVTLDLTHAPKNTCWQHLGEEIVGALQKEQLTSVISFACNPDYAWLASHNDHAVNVIYDGPLFCANLPLTALGLDSKKLEIFQAWGIRTIHDFLQLPKDDVTARLGIDVQHLWERASGQSKRVLHYLHPPESFIESFEFELPIETVEPLLFLIRRFLQSLCARIGKRQRMVGKMRLYLSLKGKMQHEREFSVPTPTLSVEVLYRILNTYLEVLQLEDPIGDIQLELISTYLVSRQLALFEKPIPDSFGITLARLEAIVGRTRMGVPARVNNHSPREFTLEEFPQELPTLNKNSIQYGLPLRRFSSPLPIKVRMLNFRPAWIETPNWEGFLSQVSGPYRFSGEWWSDAPWSIEEWDVQIEGRGLVRLGRCEGNWTLEGIYNIFNFTMS